MLLVFRLPAGIALLALASALLSACGATHETRFAFGFNENSVNEGLLSPAREAGLEQAAGATITRIPLDWRVVEPRRDVYRFGVYDRIYRATTAQGVRPLWVIVLAPAWACPRPARCRGDYRMPPARREDGQWRQIVALVARRYPRAAGIELWNEPNLRAFWQPFPDPVRYTELLRAGYRAAKQANPHMLVAGAGVSNLERPGTRGMGMSKFLEAMYRAGAKGYMDALSFHPYTRLRGEDETFSTTTQVRRIRDAAGDGGTPLWATEIGYSTDRPEPARRWSEQGQARALVEDYRRLSREPDVQMMLVHTLKDGPPPSLSQGYGLVRADGSLKPAFCDLAREAGGRKPCRSSPPGGR